MIGSGQRQQLGGASRADQPGQMPRFGPGGAAPRRRQPVVAAPFVVERRRRALQSNHSDGRGCKRV